MKKRIAIAITVSLVGLAVIVAQVVATQGMEFVSQIGDATWKAWDVAVSGNHAYVADESDGLRIINMTNPAQPVQVGRYSGGLAGGSIAVDGNYVYEAYQGLRIINVSNPVSPTLAGQYTAVGASAGVAVSGTHAYLTRSDGLHIIDVSNPQAPTQVGFYAMSEESFEVAVSGNYAFVATGGPLDAFQGLRIVNISNPANPSQTGFLSLGGTICEGVAVAGNYAYVTTWDGGLHVINVTNPATPAKVGGINPGGTARGIAVSGNYAFVAADSAYVIDVSSPNNPKLVNSYNTGKNLRDLAINGEYVYAVEELGHLIVLWYTPPVTTNIPTSGGALTVATDGTSYLFPAGTFTATVVVTHTARFSGNTPSTGNLVGIDHDFETSAVYFATGASAQPVPGNTYTVTVSYSSTVMGPAIESTLALYWWNTNHWEKESSSTIDMVNQTVTATPNHFSLWAVLGETHRVFLPFVLKN